MKRVQSEKDSREGGKFFGGVAKKGGTVGVEPGR